MSLPLPFARIGIVLPALLLAACSGGEGTGTITVADVSFSATADTVATGDSTHLGVRVTDSRGHPVSGPAVEWRSSNPSVSTVSPVGWARGVSVGSADITATSGGISASVRVVVLPVPVASVSFTSAPAELVLGATHTFSAMALTAQGNQVTDRAISFSSSNPAVLTITSWGQAAAVNPGEAVVTAASEGKQATTTVRVVSVPVGSIDVVPGPATLEPGMSIQQFALLRDQQGAPLPTRPVTWHSSNPAVAAVSASGSVSALTVGQASVVASLDGKSGSALITVVPAGTLNPPPAPIPPPPLTGGVGDGSFSIRVQFVGTQDPRAVNVVDAAVARWQRVVTNDLPPLTIDFQTNHCFTGQVEGRETIDDLLIYVRVIQIDGPGKVLARAGPCLIRSSSKLPVVGVVELDQADLGNESMVETVLTHEIGHVLGIGTLWRNQFGLLHGVDGSNPLFLGGAAQGAYRGLGAGDALVPVENEGGAGTALGHWRESVFKTELMTGWISAGHNPLSTVTVASLRDLGYGVDLTAADGYALPPSLQGQILQGALQMGSGFLLRDELIMPRYTVDEQTGRQRRLEDF